MYLYNTFPVSYILAKQRNATTGFFILMLYLLKNELKFKNLKQN